MAAIQEVDVKSAMSRLVDNFKQQLDWLFNKNDIKLEIKLKVLDDNYHYAEGGIITLQSFYAYDSDLWKLAEVNLEVIRELWRHGMINL